MSNKYSWMVIPHSMAYAVVHSGSGLVYQCENYKSALNLRHEVGGVIVNAHSLTGMLLITRSRRAWLNIPSPYGSQH